MVRSVETLPDFTGCQTAVLMAGTLTGSQSPRFSPSGSEKEWAQAAQAARAAGCKVLLGVSGQAGTLAAGSAAAAPLAQALTDSGYDGLYLDIAQREWADGARLTQLVQAIRSLTGSDKLLCVSTDAPVRGEPVPDYAALSKTADRLVLREIGRAHV